MAVPRREGNMKLEEEIEFECGHCGQTAPVKEVVLTRGVTPYLRCPACGFEESDRDYSMRKTKEELRSG
jgi:uncharacterized Zn finger protein